MTKNIAANKGRRSSAANLGALLAIGGALTWLGFNTWGQEQTSTAAPVAVVAYHSTPGDLERAFWFCDYAGTNGSVDSGTAVACTTITEELKIRNFNGDFDAMVAWWRQNKPAEHQAIEAARNL